MARGRSEMGRTHIFDFFYTKKYFKNLDEQKKALSVLEILAFYDFYCDVINYS